MRQAFDPLNFSQRLIEDHLIYITSYLEELFPFDFFLTNAEALSHLFWIAEGSCFVIEETDTLIRETDRIDEKTYWSKSNRVFAYCIQFADITFFISARPVFKQQIDAVRQEIERIEPAVLHYLELYTLSQRYISIYDSPIETHFFYNKKFDKDSFFKYTKRALCSEKLYCVSIKDYDPRNTMSPQRLLSLGEKVRVRRSEPLYNFIYDNRSLMIYACCSAESFDPNKDYASTVRQVHSDVSRANPSYIVNTGVGSPHPPDKLFDSYKEAFFALAVGTLRGSRNFILSFDDLGTFKLMLNNDLDELVAHSHNFWHPLLKTPEGEERLNTIRALIENNMRYKETAAKMYIHPNTLHYRVNKVLDALALDLTDVHDLAKLYSEIQLHDILVFCNFFDTSSAFPK